MTSLTYQTELAQELTPLEQEGQRVWRDRCLCELEGTLRDWLGECEESPDFPDGSALEGTLDEDEMLAKLITLAQKVKRAKTKNPMQALAALLWDAQVNKEFTRLSKGKRHSSAKGGL